jgi:allantoin racemase
MRIRNLLTTTSPRVLSGLAGQRERLAESDVVVEVEQVKCGPFSVEFSAEERIASPYVFEAALRAEREGVDALVIECMLDPALRGTRELLRIPVVSSAKAGMAFAISLGARIAVLGVRNGQTAFEENLRAYNLMNHVCCLVAVDVPPADLAEGNPSCLDMMVETASSAIETHRAEVILLGCTAMSAFAVPLHRHLDIPVVEPASCAIRMAVDLVRMGLSHSKRCYPTPPSRPVAPGSISVWDPTGLPHQ